MMLTIAIAILLAYILCPIMDCTTEEIVTIGTIAIRKMVIPFISLIILYILLKLGIINL